MARISRNRHAHQTAIANDGTKDISANQWNDTGTTAHIETGMFGLPTSVSTVVLSGNALLPVDSNTIVQASGSPGSDTVKNITNTNTNAQDILILTGNSADTITVNHHDSGTGNIFLLGAINKVLDTNVPMVLIRQGTIWYELTLNGGIVNANISASAAITYGKLNLSGSILNADISNSAAIAYSKLNLGGSILNADLAGSIALSKLVSNANLVLNTTQGVVDDSANFYLKFIKTASAVNYLKVTNSATGNAVQMAPDGTDSNIGVTMIPKGTGVAFGYCETMMIPMSDESTTAVAGTGTKVTVYMPWAGSIAAVYQSANTAPTTSAITLDILGNGGSTIFSTKPTIAASANTGSNGVLTSTPTTFSQGDKIQFQVNTVDTGGTTKGLKMYLVVYRTA